MTLPEDVVNDVFNSFKILKHYDNMAVVDCGLGQENFTLDFTFATAKISVPMSELVLPIPPDQQANVITTNDDTPLCRLGITYAAKPTSPLILGDTFLRSAYVVYDMTNNEISIAPTNFNAVDSNIVEIDNDGSDIVNLSGTAPPSSAATSPPIRSGTTTANSDDTSSAIHFSWSRFAVLGGLFAAIASA